VIASSGLWSFQNYRYIAPAFPLLLLTAGCALGPPRSWPRWPRCGLTAAVAAFTIAFAVGGVPGCAPMRCCSPGRDGHQHPGRPIGDYIHRKLPDALRDVPRRRRDRVLRRWPGLRHAGPGHQPPDRRRQPRPGRARFEFLEKPAGRSAPDPLRVLPGLDGPDRIYGEVVFHSYLRPGIEPRRLVGDADMQIIVASWDHVGTGEPPAQRSHRLVGGRSDRCRRSGERGRASLAGALGRRSIGDPTARWSIVGARPLRTA